MQRHSRKDRGPLDTLRTSRQPSATTDVGHEPLSARIRNTLLQRIIGGHSAARPRLVELQLAGQFGSGQAPVREALRELEKAGLVTIRPRRGSFVNDYHARTQREIYVVRGALEEAAARLATLRLRGNVDALRRHLDGMRIAARDGDLEACMDHSVGFHRCIMRAADNELLLRLWESLP